MTRLRKRRYNQTRTQPREMASYISLLICCLLVQYWTVMPGDAAAACKGYATYNLTFLGMWNNVDHPTDFPPSAHFSPIIGASHDKNYDMWGPSLKATPGIKDVAEKGDPKTLYNEIKAMIVKKFAYMAVQGPQVGLDSTGNWTGIQVKVNFHYHLVSIVSMMAPSPDWLVGIYNEDFCDANKAEWKDYLSYDLQPWDSGTDDGVTFDSINNATTPPVNIFLITKDTADAPFKSANPIPKIAVMKFKKVAEGVMTTQKPAVTTGKASGLTLNHVTFVILVLAGYLMA